MKKKWYRSYFTKGLWLVIEHLAAVVLAVSLIILVLMDNAGIRTWQDKSTKYVDSESFSTKMYQASLEILNGIDGENNLSTADSSDEKKVIDLQEVDAGEGYTYQNTSGLAYYVDDLKKWALSSWSYYDGENILVCLTPQGEYEYFYYDDFAQMMRSGALSFQVNPEFLQAYGGSEEEMTERIFSMLEENGLQEGISQEGILYVADKNGNLKYRDVWNFGAYSLKEKYAPVGADSILDVINENENWNGRLTEAYNILGSLLTNISSNLNEISQMETYKAGNTNLSYLYVDLDAHKIYSNKEVNSFYQYKTVLEDMKKAGNYAVIMPTLSECETDLKTGEHLTLANWKGLVEAIGISENFVFAVQMDGKFPVADEFAQNYEKYEQYAKWQMPVLGIAVAAAVIFLIGLVWLTVVAGRRVNDEEIHLNFFDRWFTEVAALTVVCIWGCGVAICCDSVVVWSDLGYCLVFGCLGFFTAMFFLIGYLSLVRRIKAKNLWSCSMLRWTLGLCQKFWKKLGKIWDRMKEVLELFAQNTASRIKAMFLMGAFMIFQFVVCGMIFGGGAIMIVVLLAVDVAVLIWGLRRSSGEDLILDGLHRITDGELQYKIPLDHLYGDQKTTAEYINRIGDGLDAAVENSLKNERMKTELITNVSHDIKTPLTSIINYIDLLKRENFTDPKICGYLDVLEAKAQRLKILTEDVVEASKASTGNITFEMVDLNFVEMVHQVIGEFEERFQDKNLTTVVRLTDEPAVIYADGRRMWRVLENVFNNVIKYAMEGTRVYIEVETAEGNVVFSLKNISAQPLNFSADELTERFIRGDVSRNTEGSGLGLSIAKSLTELQGGQFKLYLDGDLFKVTVAFPGRG